jgi:hypothetical protein
MPPMPRPGPRRPPLVESDKHAEQHAALQRMQERIDRMWQADYANAKKHKVHAPRKFATQTTRSQRVRQSAAWRAHLSGMHGVKRIGPFAALAELQADA